MKKRLGWLVQIILGGRPMVCKGSAFTDIVSGKPVFHFTDTLGRRWLAESRWSRFRCKAARQI